ncbi:peptidoglycan DD-metalloendopeptidase family protein [Streptomyces sp. NPDC058623]|uniref:M23 family metallopeptidase n=1 Tax=Streptomyces sp. NPDC058623 TaxID=3346563 RepID=UPI0036649003
MNDRPTSGQYPETGYDGLSTTTFAGDQAYVSYETQSQGYQYPADYTASGTYDAYGSYPSTGSYDTTAWSAPETYLPTVPSQGVPDDGTGQWDASAWNGTGTGTGWDSASFGHDPAASERTGHWTLPGYGQETGTYDATAWNGGGTTEPVADTDPRTYVDVNSQSASYGYEATTVVPVVPAVESAGPYGDGYADSYADPYAEGRDEADLHTAETSVFEAVTAPAANEPVFIDGVHDLPTQAMPVTPSEPRPSRRAGAKGSAKTKAKATPAPTPTSGSTSTPTTKGGARTTPVKTGGAGGNTRRRTPAKRSALLTVAVPSACVMGVAGVAAASVGGLAGSTEKPSEETTTMAAPDPASVQPVAANNKLDTQLAALSADAGDFADRASRTQERIDLRQRQEDEKKKRAEEAAAKEAARPKFAVPVTQNGLSASFGQAGGMWMSVHTGIDFPVSYGTPVMAATDGTVRTQWNSAYGNMAIVTSPDGTETWYCHLGSTKIRSGKVKAGDVIAYSGNSGNSTGPHLHFEVRPGGGSAIDPLAWLRSHGLDPR